MKKVIETDPPPPTAGERSQARGGPAGGPVLAGWRRGLWSPSGTSQQRLGSTRVRHERTPTGAQSPVLGGLSKWGRLLGCCREGTLSGVDW